MNDRSNNRPDLTGDITTEQDPATPESKQPQPDTVQPALPVDNTEKGDGSTANDGPEVDAKTRSNRENARKSTGAKTPEGRAASSRNTVKHGLFAADITRSRDTGEGGAGLEPQILSRIHRRVKQGRSNHAG